MTQTVYFIQCGRERFVWIGRADGVREKLRELQYGCPFPLCVVAVTNCYSDYELHTRFSDDRERGAWFKMSDELQYFIRLLQTAQRDAQGLDEAEAVYRDLSPMLQRRLPRTVVAEYFVEG